MQTEGCICCFLEIFFLECFVNNQSCEPALLRSGMKNKALKMWLFKLTVLCTIFIFWVAKFFKDIPKVLVRSKCCVFQLTLPGWRTVQRSSHELSWALIACSAYKSIFDKHNACSHQYSVLMFNHMFPCGGKVLWDSLHCMLWTQSLPHLAFMSWLPSAFMLPRNNFLKEVNQNAYSYCFDKIGFWQCHAHNPTNIKSQG